MIIDLNELVVHDLRRIAYLGKLKGYTRLKKDDLVKFIKKYILEKNLHNIMANLEMFNDTFTYYLTSRICEYPKKNLIKSNFYFKSMILKKFPFNKSFGSLTYSAILLFKQIYKYDLIPESKIEYARYMFWIKSDKNMEKANMMENRYIKIDDRVLMELKDRDPYAYYTLLILKKL